MGRRMTKWCYSARCGFRAETYCLRSYLRLAWVTVTVCWHFTCGLCCFCLFCRVGFGLLLLSHKELKEEHYKILMGR